MTVKLLVDRKIDGKDYKVGELCDTDDATEAGLISSKLAIADLTGGTNHVPPVAQVQYVPVTATTNPLTRGLEVFAGGLNAGPQLGLPGQKRKVILIGDSITAGNWVQVTFNDTTGMNASTLPEGYDTQMGFAELANAMLGLPYTFINAAKGGQKTGWMVTNLATVIASNPDAGEVWINGGVNDISQDGETIGEASIVANITTMIDMGIAAGMRVLWSTTTQATEAQAWTTAKAKAVSKANTRLKSVFANNPNVDIVDVHVAMLISTYLSDTKYFYDGLHPSNAGYFEWAKLIVAKIARRAPTPLPAISDPLEVYAIDPTKLQMMADPLMLGGQSAAAGTGVTGTQLTSLSVFARMLGGAGDVAVASVVAAPDGVGMAQKLVITAGTGACTFRLGDINSSAVPFVGGTKCYAEFFIRCIDVVNFKSAYLECLGAVTSATYPAPGTYGLTGGPSPDGITHSGSFTLRVRSPVLTLPLDLTAVGLIRNYTYLEFAGIGGGTFEIYRRTMYIVS